MSSSTSLVLAFPSSDLEVAYGEAHPDVDGWRARIAGVRGGDLSETDAMGFRVVWVRVSSNALVSDDPGQALSALQAIAAEALQSGLTVGFLTRFPVDLDDVAMRVLEPILAESAFDTSGWSWALLGPTSGVRINPEWHHVASGWWNAEDSLNPWEVTR